MLNFVQMRYSFFGQSGWKADTSREKEMLFDSERLTKRLSLFERIALASLRDQEDDAFVLGVLTSEDLPAAHLRQLKELVGDTLGDRGAVYPRPPGLAGDAFLDIQRTLAAGHGHSHVAQIVLDDDDALSRDFISELRHEAALAIPRIPHSRGYTFLSFSRGISLVHEADGQFSYYVRDIPYTNLGLTLLARTDTDLSVFRIAHKKLAMHHPSRIINDLRFYYLRSIHSGNDSRGRYNAKKPLKPFQLRQMRDRFPLLHALEGERLPASV